MGALLGIVYGILWTMILTFILLIFAVPQPLKNEDGTYVQAPVETEKSFVMNSKLGPYLTSATLAIIDRLPQGGEDYRLYDSLREYLQRNANDIKESNPDLPKETFTPRAPSAPSDEDKPQLPISVPLEPGM